MQSEEAPVGVATATAAVGVATTTPPRTRPPATVASDAAATAGGEDQRQDEEQRPRTSPMQSYLDKLSDMNRQALEKIYHNAIDVPCQNAAACENHIEESFSHLNCQQFLPFPFLHNDGEYDGAHRGSSIYSRTAPIGPSRCEYCSSPSTDHCHPDCARPRLYFLKKKPPFAKDEGWDPATEYRLDPFENGGGALDRAAGLCSRVVGGDDDGGGGDASGRKEEGKEDFLTSSLRKMGAAKFF